MTKSKKFAGLDTGRLGIWNPANMLTFTRILLAICAVLSFEFAWLSPLSALTLLVVAAVSDLDGMVARKLDCASEFGAHLDPIIDKSFIAIVGTWAVTRVGELWPLQLILVLIQILIAVHVLTHYQAKAGKVNSWGKTTMALSFTAIMVALFAEQILSSTFVTFSAAVLLGAASLFGWRNYIEILRLR